MRIRTIKPEFWSSETISPLSDKAKLLAIGLLNFADDEGYFWANPTLIRAAIFPFEDESKTILGLIQELSRAGYISTGKRGDDGRAVGRVINFTIHQRIDKPKQSIIKQNCQFQDESKTRLGTVLDASPLEGKGREQGREQGKEVSGSAHAPFPDASIPTWQEVQEQAKHSAVPEASAKTFFDHHENNSLWVNQFGRLIDWRKKLVSWAANDRVKPQKNGAAPKVRPTYIQDMTYDITKDPDAR